MSPSLGVAVFARTPGSGGKSRLANSWNRTATDIFYQHCLNCADQWLQAAYPMATTYWALTGTGSRDHTLWRNSRVLEQVHGGLGERMVDVVDQLLKRHDYWCLVGSDIPQMVPLTELALFERLHKRDVVFGPSVDGGFWLVAGRRQLPISVWTTVPYSRPDTLKKMINQLHKTAGKWLVDTKLPPLIDIDQYDDLHPLVQELEKKKTILTTAQLHLLDWLQCVLPH